MRYIAMKHLMICSVMLMALVSTSCRKKMPVMGTDPNGYEIDIPGPAIQLNSFPLTVGHMWVYDNGDTIRVVKDTTIGGIDAFKITKTNSGHTGRIYYANMSDGLHLLATSWPNAYSAGITAPLYPDVATKDSLLYPDSSFLALKLPAAIANSWVPVFTATSSFMVQKTWDSYVKVTTKAGTFNCVKLKSNGGYYTEYYSDKGLIKVAEEVNCFTSPCPPLYTYLVYVNF